MSKQNIRQEIAACGNYCSACPRKISKSESELKATAELWHKCGWRSSVVSNNEIQCDGCNLNNPCRYDIVKCVTDKGLKNCGMCIEYPCEKNMVSFKKADEYSKISKAIVSTEEYTALKKSFFEKEKNLNRIKKDFNKNLKR